MKRLVASFTLSVVFGMIVLSLFSLACNLINGQDVFLIYGGLLMFPVISVVLFLYVRMLVKLWTFMPNVPVPATVTVDSNPN